MGLIPSVLLYAAPPRGSINQGNGVLSIKLQEHENEFSSGH
jgi:hypothetical protein